MWAKKFRKTAMTDISIDVINDGEYVVNAFSSRFNKGYLSATSDSDSYCRSVMSAIQEHNGNTTNITNDITVELVDKCMQRLHDGKAAGPDDLSSKNLKYAHPLVVVQLCSLFHIMVTHSLLTENFTNDIIILLLKDKTSTVNSPDNYHAITLIPVILKLFELCL